MIAAGSACAEDIDEHVGAQVRERRIMLGLTQQQMADLIGVTCQQIYKYENGMNRIAAGRLFAIAQALDVEVSHFFRGMDAEEPRRPTPQARMLLDLARSFASIPSPQHQEAVCDLARALAENESV